MDAITSTSDTGVWDSGNIAASATYTRVSSTGTFAFHCSFHSSMVGSIVVP